MQMNQLRPLMDDFRSESKRGKNLVHKRHDLMIALFALLLRFIDKQLAESISGEGR
jgi:hypothetical protein